MDKKSSVFLSGSGLLVLLLLYSPVWTLAQESDVLRRVPEWAKDAVWYQIFPERFRNGDPGNDPTVDDIMGGWPWERPKQWQVHPWTSDWYKLQPWENNTGKGFYWETGLRRYGGDLQGVLDKLDYLEELGINAIYFNPLFESPSLHKYDAAMYHHIDNNFGPNPELDRRIWAEEDPSDPSTWQWTSADSLFLKLIRECHARGIRVIIDGVFNHVGNTFWAFQDVIRRQQASPYKDWFIIKQWDDPATPENEFEYQGWYGVRDLPEIREDERGPVAAGFREHVRAILRRWMDPNGDGDPSDGIDGWRLDVADMVSLEFWRDFRRWVREINPDAYLTGEVWWEDWNNNKMFNTAPWLQGDVFDAVMNYRFARAVKKFVIDQRTQISARAFADSILALFRDYPRQNVYVLQNLVDSHDVDRVSSQIVNPDRWYDHAARPGQNPNYDVRRPNAQERLKQRLIVGLQMTLPGAPMIYYGDEAGMWGGDDPDCRKPMVWPEFEYEPEASHPFGEARPVDSVAFDTGLFEWYKTLVHIRRQEKALRRGDIRFLLAPEDEPVLGFVRFLNADSLWIILNNSPESRVVQFQHGQIAAPAVVDRISGRTFHPRDRLYSFRLRPYQILILKPR